jgi:putative nucleotidyltransferase with HDIG domain
VFWTAATLLASALPVRLPRGTVVSVAAAPMIAAIILGGPLAAALVALVGTTDSREVRGDVPWYGTLFNHSSAVIAAVLGAVVLELLLPLIPSGATIGPLTAFLFSLAASSVFLSVSWALAVSAVMARTGVAVRTVWAQDVGGVAANFIGLAPLAWLMAQVFQLGDGVGWWATALFVVPLFTTRLAYARYVETRELFEQTIGALAKAIDARDEYTRHHSSRVSYIAEHMCRAMRLSEQQIERIKWAGYLHDVGKIGIRDHVLLKEGPLDKQERILMNQHPTIGAKIVEPARQLHAEAPLIHAHHEWFNGSGYPSGLEANEIPLGARILGIADAYEAMTSARPYRKTPLTHKQATEQLVKFSGIQFDPDIVPVLLGLDQAVLDWRPDTAARGPTTLEREADELLHHPPAPETASRPALASDDVS